MNNNQPFWILSLSGGGYRGLFTATILKEMELLAGGAPLANKFDLITGTSVGSILAAAIALEKPASEFPDLFLKNGKKIFSKDCQVWKKLDSYKYSSAILRKFNLGIFSSRYGSQGLREVLEQELGSCRFSDLKHRLLIPTINLSKGSAQIFKTPHCEEYKFDGSVPLIEAVIASSAAPTYFPIHMFRDQRYADGGLVANSPGLIGMHEAVYKIKKNIEDIRIISIGTMNKPLSIDTRSPLKAGLVTAGGLHFLKGWQTHVIETPLAAQEVISNVMLSHILTEERFLHIDTSLVGDTAKNIALDKVDDCANEALSGQAKILAQNILNRDKNSLFDEWLDYSAECPQFYN